MSEPESVSSEGYGVSVIYESDPESWELTLKRANTIIEQCGTFREQGIIDADWTDAFSGELITLIRRRAAPQSRSFDYWLRIEDPARQQEESVYAFSSRGYRHVDAVFGPKAEQYGEDDSGHEQMTIDLANYLSLHPVILNET